MNSTEFVRNPASIVDPNGFLFKHDEKLMRAIYPQRRDFYSGLINGKNFTELKEQFHLVGTSQSDQLISGLDNYLLLKHDTISPVNYCTEWSFSMLKDAALATLDLLDRLLDDDMTLQDAYPWNVIYRHSNPVFVDVTSIIENDHAFLWKAHQQFVDFFYYPLILMAQGKGRFVRQAFTDCIEGIDVINTWSYSDMSYLLRHPKLLFSLYFTSKLQTFFNRRQDLKAKLKSKVTESMKERKVQTATQKKFVKGLRKSIEKLQSSHGCDFWADYYKFQDPRADHNKKTQFLDSFFKTTPLKSVLDLGCNTGRFSMLAAAQGKSVTSVDGSEECIEGLYLTAKKNKLPINPMVVNLLNPTAGYGFAGSQFQSFASRVKSDVVLCLGLMHHLHINGRQPFSHIAKFLDSVCSDTLIFEYVDMLDGNNSFLDSGREIKYSNESVKAELGQYFNIEQHDSDRETRKIFVCRKK